MAAGWGVAGVYMSSLVYEGTGLPDVSISAVPSGWSFHSPIVKSCMISRAKFSSGTDDEDAYDLDRINVRYILHRARSELHTVRAEGSTAGFDGRGVPRLRASARRAAAYAMIGLKETSRRMSRNEPKAWRTRMS